jgi:hypothetical protein
MIAAIIVIFVVAYAAIALEHPLKIGKPAGRHWCAILPAQAYIYCSTT